MILGAAINGKIPLRISETTSGDFDDMINGFYYTGVPQNLANAPAGVSGGPSFCMFVGLSSLGRGVQLLFSYSNNTEAKMFMRGLIHTGRGTWKLVNFT